MSGLTIRGLRAGYHGRTILDGLDLGPLRPGTLTALVGPNAAGKSTLLRAVAGLVPARGSIRIDTTELIGADPRETARHVALMPQHLPHRVSLTVFEATLTALRASATGIAPGGSRDGHRRVTAALDRLGLLPIAGQPLDRLSGGQRQLASLAQAIVRDPALLLLDEPTSALDLRHQWAVMSLAQGLAREGRIVVTVLHDLALAARWADEIAVIHAGAVRAAGPPPHALRPEILAEVWGVVAGLKTLPSGRTCLDVTGLLTHPA